MVQAASVRGPALALGPQGLGQKRTLRDRAAESWAQAGRTSHGGLEARAAGHTDYRDEKLSCPYPRPTSASGLEHLGCGLNRRALATVGPVSETPASLMGHTASPGILARRQ